MVNEVSLINEFPFYNYTLQQIPYDPDEYQNQSDATTPNYIYRLLNSRGEVLDLHGASWRVHINKKRTPFKVNTVITEATGLVVNAETNKQYKPTEPKKRKDDIAGVYCYTLKTFKRDYITKEGKEIGDSQVGFYIGESKHVHYRVETHIYEARTGKKLENFTPAKGRFQYMSEAEQANYNHSKWSHDNWKVLLKRGGLETFECYLLAHLPELPTWSDTDNARVRFAVETYYLRTFMIEPLGGTRWKDYHEYSSETGTGIHFLDLNVKTDSIVTASVVVPLLENYLRLQTLDDHSTRAVERALDYWKNQEGYW